MKAAITNGEGKIWMEDVPIPAIGDYQCLCETTACATCTGTDLNISQKHVCAPYYPGVLGHESVGNVIEIGKKVKNIDLGDRFLRPACVYPTDKLGKFFSLWGGFAEYGLVTDIQALRTDHPEAELNGYMKYQQKIPSGLQLSDPAATTLITMKETASFVASAGITLNRSVLVLGAGSVGMCVTRFAKIFGGCPVIAAARRDEQLERAVKIGADFAVNVKETSLRGEIDKITMGAGVDFIIDTTGNRPFLEESLSVLARNGKVAPYASYEKGEDIRKILSEDRIAPAATAEDAIHEYMLGAVKLSLFDPEDFYSLSLPFDEIVEGFEMLKRKEAFKIVFEMKH